MSNFLALVTGLKKQTISSYIDADFKKSKLYNMGLLPTDDAEVGEYFHEAIKNCTEFVNKYQGKGWSYDYAMQIINDWMDNLEKLTKEIIHEADI